MDFSVIADNLDLYGKGIVTTAYLVTLFLIAGLILTVPLGILHTSRNPAVYWPVWLYVYVFRGTPLLIQLYLIYYGASQFEAVRESFLWPILKSPTWCALIAFTLNTGAYTTEMLRGAIETAPRGEIEAARAFGMSRSGIMRRIILPGAFRPTATKSSPCCMAAPSRVSSPLSISWGPRGWSIPGITRPMRPSWPPARHIWS